MSPDNSTISHPPEGTAAIIDFAATTPTSSFSDEAFRCDGCQRSFTTTRALNYHSRTCKTTKKRFGSALEKVREARRGKLALAKDNKRLRLTSKGSENFHAPGTTMISTLSTCDSGVINSANVSDGLGLATLEELPRHTSAGTSDSSPGELELELPLPQVNDSEELISVRPRREGRKPPRRFQDFVPHVHLPLLSATSSHGTFIIPLEQDGSESAANDQSSEGDGDSTPQTPGDIPRFTSPRNLFGLARTYPLRPSIDSPDNHMSLEDFLDETEHNDSTFGEATPTLLSPYYPYPNYSSFSLGNWYWNHGVQKSVRDFAHLTDVISSPDFSVQDVKSTPWNSINKVLGQNNFDLESKGEWEDEDAGWHRTRIEIDVPFHSRMQNPGSQRHLVGNLYHRSLVAIIADHLSSTDTQYLHLEPYEETWTPSSSIPEVRVYGELYTSPAFLDAYSAIQELPAEPGCTLQRCLIALMVWSDATHLTSFGTSKLWPAYLYIGNESKYRRCKPSLHLAHHIAYFEALPDAFKDFASDYIGSKGAPTPAFLAHCRRELFHTQWAILLDDEFLEAWRRGIVINCQDGVSRRFYPRILTYSADYPEKVLVASIRNGGQRPCPRCLVPKVHLGRMGMNSDVKLRAKARRISDESYRGIVKAARTLVYEGRSAVNGKAVEALLRPTSLVPSMNAFSEALSEFSFDHFQMLVVDILHEWEVGTWKSILIHLIRLVHEIKGAKVGVLDARYRQTPPFGKDTIRKFSSNTSDLKRLGARDFADLLQCAIPAFDGLFDEPHNGRVLDLLFICAEWHALAKLRLHTDHTLKLLDASTVALGISLRNFVSHTCSAFKTRELPREAAARIRRNGTAHQPMKGPTAAGSSSNGGGLVPTETTHSQNTASTNPSARKPKTLNLDTYKFHSLGDVATTIRQFGTTDSYSTEMGELEHRTAKSRYKRTDRKEYVKQLARIERREARLRRINQQINRLERVDDESAQLVDAAQHHTMGKTENLPLHIGTFVQDNVGDPAVAQFIPKLKKHLLPRIQSLLFSMSPEEYRHPDPSIHPDLWQFVHLKHDRIYQHNILRLHFTTYDVRRGEDIIRAQSSRCNIMALNPDFTPENGQHPFWYARVLGIYHCNIMYLGKGNLDYHPRRIEFLWVRWFSFIDTTQSGCKVRRLDRVCFPSLADQESFGFLDPSQVLRACHVIPCFSSGKSHPDGVRGVSRLASDIHDWRAYYINRFVDRDMFMRYYWGLSVGHVYTHSASCPPVTFTIPEPRDHDDRTAEENQKNIDLQQFLSSLDLMEGWDEEVGQEFEEEFEEDLVDEDGGGPDSDLSSAEGDDVIL